VKFGPKTDEVTGSCRKLRDEELHKLYSSLRIIRMIKDEMGRSCSTTGGEEEAYRILVGRPQGKKPLGGRRRGWVDNIKMNL
jgi:hypothetical protein